MPEQPGVHSTIAQDIPCVACGYNLRGTQCEHCPECGYRVADSIEIYHTIGSAIWRRSWTPWFS
jgi:hypothetical protein